jgi:hypothetical protein
MSPNPSLRQVVRNDERPIAGLHSHGAAMHRGYLITSLALFAVSFLCIGDTAVGVIRGAFGMDTWYFWGAVVFHPATAIAASFLLVKGRRAQR